MTQTVPERQLRELLTAVATMTDEVTALKRRVEDLSEKVKRTNDIVDAWQAVKTGGKFVTWIAGVGSGLAGVWLMVKAFGAAVMK